MTTSRAKQIPLFVPRPQNWRILKPKERRSYAPPPEPQPTALVLRLLGKLKLSLIDGDEAYRKGSEGAVVEMSIEGPLDGSALWMDSEHLGHFIADLQEVQRWMAETEAANE